MAVVVFALARAGGGYGTVTRASFAENLWFALLLIALLGLARFDRLPRAAVAIVTLLAGFAIWTLASAAWAPSAEGAYDEFTRVTLFVGLVLGVAAVARPPAAAWADGLALGITAVGVVSLGSRLLPEVIHGGASPRFLSGVQTRLAYPLGYWTGLGVIAALAIPLLLRAAVGDREQNGRSAALAPMPVLACVLYLTSARLGEIVLAAGWIVYFALSGRRAAVAGASLVSATTSLVAVCALRAHPELVNGPFGTPRAHHDGRVVAIAVVACGAAAVAIHGIGRRVVHTPAWPRRSVTRALTAVGVAAAILAVLLGDPVQRFNRFRTAPPALERFPVDQHFLNGSSNGRWQLWGSAVDQFRAHPLVGDGAGSFEVWWAQHGSLAFFTRNAHSLFLEQLGGLGIVGGALIAAVFLTGAAAAARRIATPLPAPETAAALAAVFVAYTVSAAVDWMWEMTVVTVVGLTALALLVGRAMIPSTPLVGRSTRAAVLVGVVAAGAMIAEASTLLREEALRQSRAGVVASDLPEARRAAASAHAVAPWAASPDLQSALVDEQAGSLPDGRRWIVRAVRAAPRDWRLRIVEARIETKLGRVRAAATSLAEAKRLNPRSPFFTQLNAP